MNKGKNKKIKIVSVTVLILILILIAGCGIYVQEYYHSTDKAKMAVEPNDKVFVSWLENHEIVFSPENPQAGIIFYPGGKVEYDAYAPLMHSCAENDILCVLVEMPLNLAVLDMDAADGIVDRYPEIDSWYMAGHSLGGSMAAAYINEHANVFDGLILLASYSTESLADEDLRILSIFGSNDQVLNMEKYENYKGNIPQVQEHVIEGGNHAYFGSYGKQKGDGEAMISNEKQILMTADFIIDFVME